MPVRIPKPYSVRQHGVDSSGRPLYFSNVDKSAWDEIVDELRADHAITITFVQGEWMERVPGGGADASAGYHDRRGCVDVRTWDQTDAQVDTIIHVASKHAVQGWRRDAAHGGMDPHAHLVTCNGSTRDMASGAGSQVASVARGGDGLSPEGRDYELKHRAKPLVLTYDYFEAERADLDEEDAMQQDDFERVRKIVQGELAPVKAAIAGLRDSTQARDQRLRQQMSEMEAAIDQAPAEVREQVRRLVGPKFKQIREQLDAALPDSTS